jgi:hypothetical protein
MQQGNVILTNEMVANSDSAYLVDKVFHDEILVISFAFVSWDGKPKFDFFGRLKKLEYRYPRPVNRILVRDNQNAWYHRGIPGLGNDVDEVAESLKDLVRWVRPSRVITIGQSMGGYGSLMYGGLIGADKAIGFGPLSFINVQQALLYHDRRWLTVMEDLETSPPPVQYFDLPTLYREQGAETQLDIFFGTRPDGAAGESVNLDAMHANRFSGTPSCRLFPFPESGHAIVKYLIDQKLINDLLFRHITSDDAPQPKRRTVSSAPGSSTGSMAGRP